MDTEKKPKSFLASLFHRGALIQTGIFVILAIVIFYGICIPIRINENGMDPAYRSGQLNFCWRPRFWFSDLHRFQVVIIKVPGRRQMLIRRIVGLPNEVVDIRKGGVYINNLLLDEPYLEHPCEWDARPTKVPRDGIFVIGDNRDVPSDKAMFGQVSKDCVIGAPLW
ncbi:MAG: signal peptidase I [Kiritimatiellia bacterium]|jgi:signal peptidase I|nr:signal peptidase I [Kiritimatiellia bacterium]MDP6847413.1 signal peptidase I [Kiritimatiellia bacterium]